MKGLLLLFIFFAHLVGAQSWVQLTSVPAAGRDDGVAFSINGIGYLVTGNQGGVNETNVLWSYNPETNSWSTKSGFPGEERQYAGAFVLEGKAYVMCGYSINNLPLKDVWQYDPQADSWKQMKDFSGAARWAFFNFTADGLGYIGAGASPDSSLADCWKYNPIQDKWTQIADYPAGRMRDVVGLSIGDQCFAGTGLNVGPLTFSNSFFEYQCESDAWKQISDFPGVPRAYAGGVGVGLKGIVGGGWGEFSDFKTDFYYLNLSGNWENAPSAPIQGWRGMSTFSAKGRAYFVTGLYEDLTRTSHLFSIMPEERFVPSLFPNPTVSKSYVYYIPNIGVRILDERGNLVAELRTNQDGYCKLPELPASLYFIHLEATETTEYVLRWVVE